MIRSFRDRRTKSFCNGQHVAAFQKFETQAERRLAILNAATSVLDLRAMRSNRLETLKGAGTGQYSIRINRQWRICFEWSEGSPGPEHVEVVDYH